ncbi:MAG TPA: PAS domain S-box protein [Verrucomicrobiae bacterium]|jgi:PAS domain S-box-containing protein
MINRDEQSRSLLAAIVDHCEDAIISLDLNGKITSWNNSATAIFGYTAEEAIGQPVMIIIPPDRADEEPEFIRRITKGDRIRHYETIRRAKNGNDVDISLTISPILDSEGKIIGASKIARDISKERKARERLRQSEEWFRVTLSSIGDAVIATDADANITYMNSVAEELTGWSSSEVTGKPLESVFRIVNERTRQIVENPVARVLQHGAVVGLANHTVLIRKDGTERPIDDSGAPIRGAGSEVVGVVLVFRDVAEHRTAELTSLRLAAIVQNSDDAIISKNLQGIVMSWNEGAQRIFGYTPEEIVGRSILTLIPSEMHSQEPEILARLQRGERILHFETERVAKSGKRIAVSLTISPIKDAEGHVIGASKIARDITEQKAVQEALQKAKTQLELHAEQLEGTVAERTKTLQKTVEELESFSYSLSHDMRAPLRTIQSFLEIVLNDQEQRITGEGQRLLRTAVKTAERMDKLILDLLSFVRVSRSPIVLKSVNAGPILRSIIEDRPAFQPPKAVIEIENGLPEVEGDATSLSQCLTNLLDNAVKFVAPGVTPHVRIRSESRNDRVRIWVEDNGIGIDPESQHQLFKVFQRINASSYEGTGIGLALVHKAAERMGGEVGVESELGKGSRFWLDLQKAQT